MAEFLDSCIIETGDKLRDKDLLKSLNETRLFKYINEKVKKPLTIAVMYGSVKIIQYLIVHASHEQQMDLMTVMTIGSYLGYMDKEKEKKIFSIFQFSQKLNSNIDLKSMLLDSYFHELRPFELAVLLGRKHLMSIFLKINGVYKSDESCFGTLSLISFDFSEYSPFHEKSRYFLSPMRLLTLIDIKTLQCLEGGDSSFHPLVLTWLREIKQRNIIFVILNIIVTFLILAVYLLVLAPTHYRRIYTLNFQATFKNDSFNEIPGSGKRFCNENSNNSLPDKFQQWTNALLLADKEPSFLLGVFVAVKYLIEVTIMSWVFIRNHALRDTIQQTMKLCSTNFNTALKSYFALYLKIAILILIILLTTIFSFQDSTLSKYRYHKMIAFDFFSILMAGLLIFDFLYQVSIIPFIGPVIQRLLRSFSLFIGMSGLYFVTLIVFGTLFFDMMPCLSFEHYIESSSILSSWIAVFHLTLNIIDFPNEEFQRVWMLQLMLVLVLPFFMLNFIITVINEEVTLVAQHCDSFNRLYIINFFYNSDAIFYFPPIRWFIKKVGRCKPKPYKVLVKNSP